jgi:ABC-type phosphate transport system substrate-binding protein
MTKRLTRIPVVLLVALLLFVAMNCFAATGVLVNAAGSTGAFNAFALAADNSTSECGTNIWTKKNGGSGIDNRNPTTIPANTGNIWIVWNNAKTVVCSYLAVDSVIGQQLFMAVPRGSLSINSSFIGSAGDDLVATLTDVPLPSTVYNLINKKVFNCAPTDIRPEDALFEENRVLAPLDTVHYNGLGYGPGPIGKTILSSQSTKSVTPVAYAISGTDPITKAAVAPWTAINVGAQAVMIFVNTTDTAAGGFGTSAVHNITRWELADVLNGTLTRTRDIIPLTGLPSIGLHVFLREPTSGTYSTTEFSIPRSVEIGSTQELNVNPATNNPLDISEASGGTRQRVVGTGEMVSTVGATKDAIGYSFWSTTTFAKVTSTTKYLSVDGVDPLFPAYTHGTFPTCTAPCPGLVPFTNVMNGSYPLWNILRITTPVPTPAAVATLISEAQTHVANVPDFVAFSNMHVFRAHYPQSGRAAGDGFKTVTYNASAESGGDIGGAVFAIQADADFFTDTGKEITALRQ